MSSPQILQEATTIADLIIQKAGPDIVLALPLGLGKANSIANALYQQVADKSDLSLTILTALTLEKPVYENDLHRRFLQPVIERLFGDYPELLYAVARRQGTLPANVRVEEFFFLAGSQLNNSVSQQDHICANYTHALRYLLDRGVNVLAQMVAEESLGSSSRHYSASCNTDLTMDMLAERRTGKASFLFVGEVNRQLPFMGGDALLAEDEFEYILPDLAHEPKSRYSLFAPPRLPVSSTDYAAAMHVARIIPDGGTLQIGIGSLGDALTHCLKLRHLNNPLFRDIATVLVGESPVSPFDQLTPFKDGLHGLSEMLVEGFLHLYDAGILIREIDGAVLDAAFFLGSVGFYKRLRECDKAVREKFAMRSIFFTNEVIHDTERKLMSRVKARFVNKAMMVTLRGEVISDGLEDGRVVSGVGGQFDFVVQAFALYDARSIIVVPATRKKQGKVLSNILWSYGNTTVPRHLRDIVVTEYGIADLRGKTDAGVVAAMLSVADSRFQESLRAQAVAAGKLSADYRIPEGCRSNTPERIARILSSNTGSEAFPAYPLGTEFTATEQELMAVLEDIKAVSHSKPQLITLAIRGLFAGVGDSSCAGIKRMGLESPHDAGEWMQRLLLQGGYARGSR